ncbi:ESPR-type extended signal peptide-containing protein [Burkholderia ubonensis]|uniref:ESPR-type extended signal peptide-containing protein n=1 Tax=Burkholderia ubonensis TaxID=101571 RepID=UPI0007564DB9|nr:ESPR-type extended signal peptide-containing protein [Burkholderia ubonensis]KVD55783.1 hypothetical protein WI86_08920 [Burkholderia ubonensis]KVU25860.1 hypothetical protein WK64_26450 [Burkholderia ubonensis]KVU37181.1 hypothetical protein WK65_22595 [Burkholderia ubonensis]
MNQQAYKIKFSGRLGTWVAVSELTRGARKGSGGTSGGAAVRAGAVGGLKQLVMALVLGGHLHRRQKEPHVIRNPFKEKHVSYAA